MTGGIEGTRRWSEWDTLTHRDPPASPPPPAAPTGEHRPHRRGCAHEEPPDRKQPGGLLTIQAREERGERSLVVAADVARAAIGQDEAAGGGVVALADGDLGGGHPLAAVARERKRPSSPARVTRP